VSGLSAVAADEVRRLPGALAGDVLAVLKTAADPFDRALQPAHVTASAVVLSADSARVLLVRHRKLQLWLHPGGHVEPGDTSLQAAALREAVEETGVEALTVVGGPADVHRHPAPCQPPGAADHLDVRFVLTADGDAVPVVSEESTDVRWFACDALPADAVPDLAALVELGRGRLRAVLAT